MRRLFLKLSSECDQYEGFQKISIYQFQLLVTGIRGGRGSNRPFLYVKHWRNKTKLYLKKAAQYKY
jgi:hypothetical protein